MGTKSKKRNTFNFRALFGLKFVLGYAVLIYVVLLIALIVAEETNEDASIINLFDAFWYSIVTLTTVGYGDYYPVTPTGKWIGMIFVLSSMGVLGLLISTLTAFIQSNLEKRRLGFMGANFENHIIVIGWNRFGQNVCDQIIKSDHKVAIVTDRKEDVDLINSIYSSEAAFVVYSNLDNLENLDLVNVSKCAKIFLNFEDDTTSLVYVLNLKRVYPDINVIVSLNNSKLKDTFSSAGVTYAVSKESIIAKLVASYIFEPDVAEITEDMMAVANAETDYDLQEYQVIEDNPYLNENCLQAFVNLKTDYNCIFMGLAKKNMSGSWDVIRNPGEEVKIEIDNYVVVLANGETKYRLQESFGVLEGRIE